MFRISQLKYYIAAGSLLGIMASCNNDASEGLRPNSEIMFTGYLEEPGNLKTRYESGYIKGGGEYDQNFYIQLCCDQSPEEPYIEYGTYRIPSGYEGRLAVKDSGDPLNWHDFNSLHTFYSWTIPWSNEYYAESFNDESINIVFSNSNESDFATFSNNSIYETFIGAKTTPYSYNEHGKYVDMTFFHLVSKIKIGTFQLTEASGAIQRNLKAEVTFINIPTSATFYPHPDPDIAALPYCKEGMPVVVPEEANPNSGLTYFISNQPENDKSDIFYICPEIDFTNVSYQVKLKDVKYKDYDTYYGTFNAVNFVRNNEDYDYPNGGDTKILHAGEMMTINITLIPGVGPGLDLVIDDWSTEKPQEATYHTYPGIYDMTEMNQLRDLFLQMKNTNDQETLDQLNAIFDLYGYTENGQKILRLYDNLTLSGDYSNIFPIWKDYILDGLGHTVTLKTNTGNYWGTGNKPYFNIGPCKNIYFTDPTGSNTIYIDNDGYVWVTDKTTGLLTQTTHKLPDLKTYGGGDYNSFDINAETGEIRVSKYFNNNITG